MLREDLKGIYSALLVPFNQDGSINEAELRKIVRHNISKMNVDGLYVGGSTGENFLLSLEEKKEIFKIVKDEVKSEIKLIAQVGGPNLYEAIELGKMVTELGYDAISAVTPFYYKFSFNEVFEYYKEISENVDNDLIVYMVPVLTGVGFSLDDFEKLYSLKNIVGVKYTAGDFYLLERMRKRFPNQLIFSGFDEMLLPALNYNIDGAIGSTFNVNGNRAKEIIEAFKSRNFEKALELQNITNDLIQSVVENGLYQTLKAILEIENNSEVTYYTRKPMAQITNAQKLKAKEIYEKFIK